jgi:hypothetical protein
VFSSLDLRTRQVLLILVLAVAAAGAGLLTLSRLHHHSGSSPSAAAPNATPAAHSKPRPVPHHRATTHRAVPTHASKPATKPAPKHHAAAAAPRNRLPAGIRRAFAADQIVVVALYDPKAKIDGPAMAEAKAGAKLADSSFVPVDVRKNGVNALNTRYGVIQDPAVLVLRPSGQMVVRIDGFADRDTVAQAALNAAS